MKFAFLLTVLPMLTWAQADPFRAAYEAWDRAYPTSDLKARSQPLFEVVRGLGWQMAGKQALVDEVVYKLGKVTAHRYVQAMDRPRKQFTHQAQIRVPLIRATSSNRRGFAL